MGIPSVYIGQELIQTDGKEKRFRALLNDFDTASHELLDDWVGRLDQTNKTDDGERWPKQKQRKIAVPVLYVLLLKPTFPLCEANSCPLPSKDR